MLAQNHWLKIWFLFLCTSISLHSQSDFVNKVDSLTNIIETASDTNKANAFYQLGRAYVLQDSFAKAIEVLNKGADYSKSQEYHKHTGKIYEYIGIANDISGNLDAALEAYAESRRYHEQVPDNEYSLNLLDINIGVAYYFAGELGKSLEYYLKAYNDAKELGLSDNVAKLVNNIAIIYRRSEKYEDALRFYKESLALKIKANNKDGIATTYQNMGGLYSYMGKLDSAIHYLDKSREMMISIDASQSDIDYVDYARAEVYYNMNDFSKSLDLMTEFEKSNFSTLSESVRLNGKIVLADLYAKTNNHSRAVKILNQVEAEIGTDDYLTESQQLFEARGKSYMELGAYQSAAFDFKSSGVLLDSINSVARQKLESEMQTKYSTLKKEQEIQKLTSEQELSDFKISQQQKRLWIVSIVVGLLSILLYRLFKQKSQIQTQNIEISKSAKEKDILLREIHHRVKNNLQVISSLLSIQGRSIKDRKAKEAIQEGRNRVQSMSLIHQNLYKKDNLTGIEMEPYIHKLANHLLHTYQVESGDIEILSDVDNMTLDVETVVPIGLIINELISNSLKYAFPNSSNGWIRIDLKHKNEALLLTVSDNGIGLSEEQLNLKTESFGHTLIRAFKNKLEADIDISGAGGTSVSLLIRNYKKVG